MQNDEHNIKFLNKTIYALLKKKESLQSFPFALGSHMAWHGTVTNPVLQGEGKGVID